MGWVFVAVSVGGWSAGLRPACAPGGARSNLQTVESHARREARGPTCERWRWERGPLARIYANVWKLERGPLARILYPVRDATMRLRREASRRLALQP